MWRAVIAAFLLLGASGETDTLGSLARRYSETGSPQARAALARFAAEQADPAQASLAYLALGIGDYQEKKFAPAAEELALAAQAPGDLADYAVYYRALALAGNGDQAGAAWVLADFRKRFPSSPLLAAALRQRAESLSLSGHAREALELLSGLRQTGAAWLLLLAQVTQRAGDGVRAAQMFQRVYYEFPASPEQAQALAAMNALRLSLKSKYPDPPARLRLTRADKLAAAQRYLEARKEYRALSLRLKGPLREEALVRIGACDYELRANLRAYRYLKSLHVTQPEAAAERLYYLAALARRLNREGEFIAAVAEMGRQYPSSPRYEEALFAAGNYYLVENDAAHYIPYYRRLVEKFPNGRYAASAHWRIAWNAYVERKAEARQLLEGHIRRYPDSQDLSGAVYWSGRLAEAASDWPAARAYYDYLGACCPNYYYGILARERLQHIPASSQTAAAPTPPLLAALPSVTAPPPAGAAPEWPVYLRRARLLARLGLFDLEEKELRFRAESPQFAHLAGMELAEQAAERGSYHQAIRYLKRYTPGYLAYPLDSMPRHYWELLFPLPWRSQIESYSKERQLDPYLVAALIRQESEFNPGALSRARARGLMQILPSTGRRLGRNLGITVQANRLYAPDTSLRLGTLYLRRVLDQYNGRIEPALAGYNAGEHRADKWLDWRAVDDPAEFVENIPFNETRNYVQAVIRNAAIYRKLYGS
jgi:soluble lytic murein transglycosylase